MRLTTLTTLVLMGLASTASADGVHCPIKVPPPKKTPEKPACSCKGEQGPPGPKGDPGKDGKDGITQVIEYAVLVRPEFEPPVRLSLGVMGFASDPHGDWAWGPALGLSARVHPKYDLELSVGLAAGASDGRESGYMLGLVGSRRVRPDLRVFGGVYRVSIDGSPDNGRIDGDYLGLTAGLTLGRGRTRLSIGPTLAGLRDDWRPDTRFALGMQTSLFVRL